MDTPLSKSTEVVTIRKYQPDIYVPKPFPELDSEGKAIDPLWVFKPFELRYLDALHRGEDPEKALEAAGITRGQRDALLKRGKARDYLAQLLRQKFAAEAWSQEKWISEGTRVWDGQKKDVSREQMEAWKEIGARVCPKPEKSHDGSERPNIVININAAESALKRQEIIEGQIIEPNGSDRNL